MVIKNNQVCMLVKNNFLHDSRIYNEAISLMDNGYRVKFIAIKSKDTEFFENKDGIFIYRVKAGIDRNFLHRRLVKLNRSLKRKRNRILDRVRYFRDNKVGYLETISNKKLGAFASLITSGFHKILIVSIKIFFKVLISFFKAINNVTKKIIYLYAKRVGNFVTGLRMFRTAYVKKADIYHSNDLNTLLPGFLAAKLNKAKIVYDSHELELDRNIYRNYFQKKYESLKEKILIKKVDGVITSSPYFAKALKEKYGIAMPVVVMNCPSIKWDMPHNEVADMVKSMPGRKLIYVGRLTTNRGIEQIIASMKYVDETATLLIIGAGNNKYIGKLNDLISECGAAAKVKILDPIKHDQVVGICSLADIGLSPIQNSCLSYYYSAPNKIFQFMMAEIPVAASHFPFYKDLINGHEVGETFDEKDPQDIAKSIKLLLGDERFNRARESYKNIKDIYTWENESKKLVELYRSLSG